MKNHLIKNLFSIALAVLFLFGSCSSKVYNITGVYDNNKTFETSTSYDKVWDNAVDYFARTNLTISTLDKTSGIIAVNKAFISRSYVGVEDKNGNINNPNAWIVLPYAKDLIAGEVTCSVNVRIKKMENGNTSISINLGQILCNNIYKNWLSVTGETYITTPTNRCASTGVFENMLYEIIK